MGNLGAYQDITRLIKALGGPKRAGTVLIGGAITAGGLLTVGAQMSVRAVSEAVRRGRSRHGANATVGEAFTVHTAGTDGQGLDFRPGDTYTVLERDDDAILVEVVGRSDNPFFASAEFLSAISDYLASPTFRGRTTRDNVELR